MYLVNDILHPKRNYLILKDIDVCHIWFPFQSQSILIDGYASYIPVKFSLGPHRKPHE